jgi:hypothetical protein
LDRLAVLVGAALVASASEGFMNGRRTMKARVWMHSKPGMWEYYHGYVDVVVDKESEAFEAACQKLRRNSFPDRSRAAWVLDRIERSDP